jgi:epoxyqueuosine reductase
VLTKSELASFSAKAGFDDCRCASAQRAAHADEFRRWLETGRHADMHWLARDPERRVDPRQVLEGCRTVIILSKNYYQWDSRRTVAGRIARYAWGEDYHNVLQPGLTQLSAILTEHGGRQRCYIDTGPVLERDWAEATGISWTGKSTMSLNRTQGTWFFLAVILTTLEFEPDGAAVNRCGSCTRCIEACPTGAITAPYQLDARRCLSYWTIENKGPIPIEFRHALGDRIYGCDDCLDACPWNRFSRVSHEQRFQQPVELAERPLRSLALMSEDEFRVLFRRSPIKRIKHKRFVRNICVALGNVGSVEDLSALERLEQDQDPLIAEHAAWAKKEIESRIHEARLERSHS